MVSGCAAPRRLWPAAGDYVCRLLCLARAGRHMHTCQAACGTCMQAGACMHETCPQRCSGRQWSGLAPAPCAHSVPRQAPSACAPPPRVRVVLLRASQLDATSGLLLVCVHLCACMCAPSCGRSTTPRMRSAMTTSWQRIDRCACVRVHACVCVCVSARACAFVCSRACMCVVCERSAARPLRCSAYTYLSVYMGVCTALSVCCRWLWTSPARRPACRSSTSPLCRRRSTACCTSGTYGGARRLPGPGRRQLCLPSPMPAVRLAMRSRNTPELDVDYAYLCIPPAFYLAIPACLRPPSLPLAPLPLRRRASCAGTRPAATCRA